MLGGALACGFTHAGITPLDVAKCNMQVSGPIRSLARLLNKKMFFFSKKKRSTPSNTRACCLPYHCS
jgi:hypothetical protein